MAPETLSPAQVGIADGHHLARGAAANLATLLAANFRAVFTFLIARVLGTAAFGRFNLAFAAVELLSKIGMLGFDASIVPMVAPRAALGDRDGSRACYRRALAWAASASALLALGALALVRWLPRGHGLDPYLNALSGGGSIMLLALPAIAIARVSTGASRGVLAIRDEFYSRGIGETWITIAVFLVAISLGIRDGAPALAVVCGLSAAALVACWLATRSLARISESRSQVVPSTRPNAWWMLRFSLPTAGSSLLNVLVTQADVLLLGAYVGRAPGVTLESFGVFAVAAEIAVGLRKVRQIFDPIFAPVVSARAGSAHRDSLKETVAGPGRWVLAAQLPLVGALLLSSGAVLSIYGAGFRQGALWLALLALAHGANAFAGLVETLLMVERPGLNLINASVTIVVQLATGVVLIPRYGVNGAALAMCLGFATQGVLRFVEVRHVFGWSWPWHSLARPLAAFTIAMIPAALLRWLGGPAAEIAAGLMFLAAYGGAWWWMGAEPADREIWRTLVRRR